MYEKRFVVYLHHHLIQKTATGIALRIKDIGLTAAGINQQAEGERRAELRATKGYKGEDVSKLPKLTDALLKKGYSEADIEKILGGNILRVMEAVEKLRGQN